MADIRGSSDAPKHNVTEQHTETSPLKQNDEKKSWFYNVFWNPIGDQEQSSLRTIILNFLAFTTIVTIALIVQIYYGKFEIQPHGNVASDSYECSMIGIETIKKGGNAVDAAIAATFCLGVVNFHITGLGGGGYMMIYNHKKREVLDIIDFQASLPKSAGYIKVNTAAVGSTVGVPGLLLGLWEAHQKFGKFSWKEIVMPSLNLAKHGFTVSKNVISASSHINRKSKNNKSLKQFFNSLTEGKNVTFPELAGTLEEIAFKGAQEFYNGSLAMDIIYTVKEANGSMTLEDISQYQTSHSELLHTKFGNFNILAPGSSSGGPLLLNALDNIQFLDLSSNDDVPSIILKMSDILHDAYVSFIEKNNAVPNALEAVGSQVVVTDNEDLFVVIVSGLNSWLGSQLLTEAGFILNNAVVNGGINHERRPLSFSAPVIAIDSKEICGRRLVLGSGDATIAAQVLTYALIFNKNISVSVESPRFFVDTLPRHIRLEDQHYPFYKPSTINKLRTLMKIEGFPPPYKSINVVEKIDDVVTAYSDSRGGNLPFHL